MRREGRSEVEGLRDAEGLRYAATVIAVRAGPGGPEVLVLQRARGSQFLPGYVVFPGGAVERRDRERAVRWFGTADEMFRACAVRELAEEAGLALTTSGLEEAGRREPLAAVDAAPPSAAQLSLISHWIAPETAPVRFNVRFFGVSAPEALEPRPDGHEAIRAWWIRPEELLRQWTEGQVRLFWPTMKMVEAISGHGTVEGVLAARIPQREPLGAAEEEAMPPSTFDQRA